MSKKLLIALAPLAAIVALAMVPVGAQAVGPHYTVNGAKSKEGSKIKSIAWGKLKNESAAGTITCENMALGNIENPTGGGPGKVETLNFVTVECTLTGCPAHAFARPVPGSLPWDGELIEAEEKIRQDTGIENGKGEGSKHPVKVFIGCETAEGGTILAEEEFFTNEENHQKPVALNGFSGCNKPSELEFDTPGSGSLGSVKAGPGKTTLSLKTCGYLKQDLLGSTKE